DSVHRTRLVYHEIVRERHGVVALGIVRAEEQSDFARRYKIYQVLDCGVIGAELFEVSLVKLAPPARVMAKPSPEAGARGDVLQPHVDAGMLLREPARPDAVDEHPRTVRGLGRLVRAFDTKPRRAPRHWILQPSPQRRAPRAGLLSRNGPRENRSESAPHC